MAITDKNRKILWAKSGNLCAICKKPLYDDIDVLSALLGTEQLSIDIRTMRSMYTRALDGIWLGPQGPRNSGLSGVLVVDQLRSWYVSKASLTLYLNPWAAKPLSSEILGVRTIEWEAATGQRIDVDGADGSCIFGLPADWPEESEDVTLKTHTHDKSLKLTPSKDVML